MQYKTGNSLGTSYVPGVQQVNHQHESNLILARISCSQNFHLLVSISLERWCVENKWVLFLDIQTVV